MGVFFGLGAQHPNRGPCGAHVDDFMKMCPRSCQHVQSAPGHDPEALPLES